jgi:hypothetical protein
MKASTLWFFSLLPTVRSAFIIQGHASATTWHFAGFNQDQILRSRSSKSPKVRSHSARTTTLQLNQQRTTKYSSNYSDDFFGLIFLTPLIMGDRAFASVFLVFSALAASIATTIATNANATKTQPTLPVESSLVPGLVALMSVGVTAALRFVAPLQVEMPSTTVIGVETIEALCSVAYGYFLSTRQNKSP